jgi:protein-tyrosine phosphatase
MFKHNELSTYMPLTGLNDTWTGALYLSACPVGVSEALKIVNSELITDMKCKNISAVITLLETEIAYNLGMTQFGGMLGAADISWTHFPIPNMGIPSLKDLPSLTKLVNEVINRLKSDQTVFIHCYAGLGRTGLLAGIILTSLGMPAELTIHSIRNTRPGSIETKEQEAFVKGWVFNKPTLTSQP